MPNSMEIVKSLENVLQPSGREFLTDVYKVQHCADTPNVVQVACARKGEAQVNSASLRTHVPVPVDSSC